MTADDTYRYYDDHDMVTSGPPITPKRRPRLTNYLPIRFAPEYLGAARALAIEDGVSISTWVRTLVEREVLRRSPATTTTSNAGEFRLIYPAPQSMTAPPHEEAT
jgi:hypothetical protein